MKKVKYAVAAVGLAPALGLAAGAVAVPASAAAPKKPDKVVSLLRNHHAVVPDVVCGTGHHVSNLSTSGLLKNRTFYSTGGGGCANHVIGALMESKSGLAMRTKIIQSGVDLLVGYNSNGNEASGITAWSTTINNFAGKVCIALVDKPPHHSHVIFGPVCDSI